MHAAAATGGARLFRWAARLAAGIVIGAIVVLIALFLIFGSEDGGAPILFFTFIYVVIAVPICLASAVLAGMSLAKGEARRGPAIAILIVMGWVAWTFKAAPFRLADSLIEGYLQRPWP